MKIILIVPCAQSLDAVSLACESQAAAYCKHKGKNTEFTWGWVKIHPGVLMTVQQVSVHVSKTQSTPPLALHSRLNPTVKSSPHMSLLFCAVNWATPISLGGCHCWLFRQQPSFPRVELPGHRECFTRALIHLAVGYIVPFLYFLCHLPVLLQEEPLLQQDPGISGRSMEVLPHAAVRRAAGAGHMSGTLLSPTGCV